MEFPVSDPCRPATAAGCAGLRAASRRPVSLAADNYKDARSQYRAGTLTQTQMGEFHLAYSEARFGLVTLYFMERGMEIEVEALVEEP